LGGNIRNGGLPGLAAGGTAGEAEDVRHGKQTRDPSARGADRMMDHNGTAGAVSGFTCPACGGALWERQDGDGLAFECRIGDRFAAAELWIEHCTRRNQALKVAERLLAENAALAQRLATWAVGQGNSSVAARMEQEAAEEKRLGAQVRAMLEGLPAPRSDSNQGAKREETA
jgi:hypothetical protein